MGLLSHASGLLPVLPILLGFLLLALAGSQWVPLYRFGSKEVLDIILLSSAFFLFGIHGIICAIYKEFPVFWPPLKGKPAVVAGVILAVVSFGLDVLLIMHNWNVIASW